MSLPYKLHHMTTREAITDAIYRATGGFDANDWDMVKSAFTSDVVFEVAGQTMKGADEVKANSFNHVGAMDTTHMVSNVRVHYENEEATTATATANALAQHYPTGTGFTDSERKLLVGSRYEVDLIKDEKDGLWKAKHFVVKPIWREGDMSVMVPESSK